MNVSNGTATVVIPANSLAVGSTTVTANYSGDLYYTSSSATAPVNTIGAGTLKPVITVTAPTGVVNYPVTLSVTIKGTSGSPTPTGSVSLTNELNFGTSAPLTNGAANFVVQSKDGLNGGLNPLHATYLGDSNFTSGTGTGSVTMITDTRLFFQTWSPSLVVNEPLSVSLQVNPASNNPLPVPTGTVTFTCGSYSSSPVAVVAGYANLTIPANSLAIGADTLTASYSGDGYYNPSTASDPVTVMAIPVPGIVVSGTPISVQAGARNENAESITVTGSGGFSGSVVLTASIASSPVGAVNLPTFSFGVTSPVNVGSGSSAVATLTVLTQATTTAGARVPERPRNIWYTTGGAALGFIVLFGIPARSRKWRSILTVVALLGILGGGVVACGGGGGGGGGPVKTTIPGTTPGAYTVTVTGTSGSLTSLGTITVTVY